MAPEKKNIEAAMNDLDLKDLPETTEEVHGSTKIRTEYDYDEDDKIIKIVSTYKIEKKKVCKAVAERKLLKKYGLSKDDKPGPNPATTITAEEVQMQFITNKVEEEDENDEMKKKLIDSGKGGVSCRLCKEAHWTSMCPYKDQLTPIMGEEKDEGPADAAKGNTTGKYIPPSMREGAKNPLGSRMGPNATNDQTTTVRVANLSENTREADLQELCKRFGDISRVYLAKDKATGNVKGFAYVTYKRREEAEKAIQGLNGFGYDHLILSVEWARQDGRSDRHN